MHYEEEDLFATAESDERNSARVQHSRRRVEDLLRDRTKKRNRLRKKGRTDLEPWLREDALSTLRRQIREMDTYHHRKTRSDRAVRQDRKSLKPIALKHLKPGTIIDCWVPFVDTDDYKRRPAVVIEADKYDVRLYPLTTSLGHRRLKIPIYLLHRWAESGLSRPTGMQRRPVTVPRSDVLAVTGELLGEDRSQFYLWVNAGTRAAAATSHMIAAASHLNVA